MNTAELTRRPKLELNTFEINARDDERKQYLESFIHDVLVPSIRRQVKNTERRYYTRDIRGAIMFSITDAVYLDNPRYNAHGVLYREGPLKSKMDLFRYFVRFPLYFHGSLVDVSITIAITELIQETRTGHNRLLADRIGQDIVKDVYSRLFPQNTAARRMTMRRAIPDFIKVYPFETFRMEDIMDYLANFGINDKGDTSDALCELCEKGKLVIAPYNRSDRNRAYTNSKTRYAHTSNVDSWLNLL